MTLIADLLLLAASLGAGVYCFVLSRRLTRFTDLETGVGGAVALLSVQVDELKSALSEARETAAAASERLEETTHRASETSHRLEMLLAGTHGDDTPPAAHDAGAERRIVRRRRAASRNSPKEDAA